MTAATFENQRRRESTHRERLPNQPMAWIKDLSLEDVAEISKIRQAAEDAVSNHDEIQSQI